MKNGFIRVIAAVLILVMALVPLSGCGKKNNNTSSEYVYVPEYVTLPKDISGMDSTVCVGDTIYFSSNVALDKDGNVVSQDDVDAYYDNLYGNSKEKLAAADSLAATEPDTIEDPPFTYEYRLFSIKMDGTEYRRLDAFTPKEIPDSDYAYYNINRIFADADGNLYLVENVSSTVFNLPADFDETTGDRWQYYVKDENNFYLRAIDSNGATLSETRINDLIEGTDQMDYFYLGTFAIDKDNNIYFINDNDQSLYVITTAGAIVCKLQIDGSYNGLVNMKDGSVGVCIYEDAGQVIKMVDTNKKDWGETFKAPMNAWNFSSGGDEYDFCYNNGNTLYGYDVKKETETKILNWINSDVDGNNINLCQLKANGDVFAIYYYYDNNTSGYEVVNLVKKLAKDVEQKEAITLATVYLDYDLRSAILDFNKTNQDYRIEVIDYSEFNTEEDYSAGMTKLNTEIISGKVPDIIALGNLPVKQYVSKGLLEDLYPFIDGDSEFNRTDFVQAIMKVMETNGKLYSVCSSFGLVTMAGHSSILGSEPGWTVSDLKQIIDAHPEADYPLGQGMSRADILNMLLMFSMDDYIDWSTGKCSFDTANFKSLLEFANSFPNEIDYENMDWKDDATLVKDGRQLASFFSLYDFNSFQYYKAAYGDDIVFKGLPGLDGGGSVANLQSGLAMTTSCKNKDAAWEFMRILLTEKYQATNSWNLPTNQAAFDAKLKEAMKQEYYIDENGVKQPQSTGGMSVGDGETVEFYAITQEEADMIMALINSVKYVANYDDSVYSLISEEASAYFDGAKSVDEVASIIQSRMSIYINEQR